MENKNNEKALNRVALLRKERGWSQRELGEKLFIDRRTICNIEKGIYNLPNLVAIADLFNVTLDYILWRSDLRVNVQDGFDEVDILVLEQIKDYTTAEKERLLKHLELDNSLKNKNGN
ncbi:MAG: helix-turn-helix transcriptional regulator [Oscillospiraceae bacterium]|nr:helix-turn-helix transcriptional regulator [Oscillospiraceae bacterium]